MFITVPVEAVRYMALCSCGMKQFAAKCGAACDWRDIHGFENMDSATTTEHDVRVFCRVAGHKHWNEISAEGLQSEEYLYGRRYDDIEEGEE